MRKEDGVTLMELIIVVAIIAILASVGYPNYVRLKQETRRADGQTSVVATEGIVERYLAENNKANIDSSDMALAQFSNYSTSSGTPQLSNDGYYRITIVPDGTGYAVNATATVTGGLSDCTISGNASVEQCADTACRVISIYHGQKQSTNSTGTVANATTTTCW